MEDKKLLPPQPLSPEELALLNWLLENGSPEAKTFVPQIEGIRAAHWCSCGCPSINLHIDENAPPGSDPHGLVADMLGKTCDGQQVGVILFHKDRKLSLLEVYALGLIEGAFGLPSLDSLQTSEWGSPQTTKSGIVFRQQRISTPN